MRTTDNALRMQPGQAVALYYAGATSRWNAMACVRFCDALPDGAADGAILISADQHDYVLAERFTRLSADSVRTFTGFAGGQDGMVRWIYNVGPSDFLIQHESAMSKVFNRVNMDYARSEASLTGYFPSVPETRMNNALRMQPGQAVALYYAGATRWIANGSSSDLLIADQSALSAAANDPMPICTCDIAALMLRGCTCGAVTPYRPCAAP